MAFDFRKWLTVQPDDVTYNFMDATGNCAMGKCMAAHGEKWNMTVYSDHMSREFGRGKMDEYLAVQNSQTFGELKRKLELV